MTILHTAAAGFQAARRLPRTADCRANRHGHGFRVQASSAALDLPDLRTRLRDAVAPLDYADLDPLFSEPDDLAVASRLQGALGAPAALTLTSAPDRGVELDADGRARVWARFAFEAAHHLPHVPAGHKCGRLHGHGFGVRLVATADQADHAALEHAWQPLFAALQHRYLNDITGLSNPTSEVIAGWLWQQLDGALAGLAAVEVFETATAGSRFDGRNYRIWKEQRFESAVPFDASGKYTGHSYLVRLHLAGQLDELMGWVRDFGDVKAVFAPCYRQLDHHPLDALPGIDATDCAGIARWVAGQLRVEVPQLCRIDLLENETDGAVLLTGETA